MLSLMYYSSFSNIFLARSYNNGKSFFKAVFEGVKLSDNCFLKASIFHLLFFFFPFKIAIICVIIGLSFDNVISVSSSPKDDL